MKARRRKKKNVRPSRKCVENVLLNTRNLLFLPLHHNSQPFGSRPSASAVRGTGICGPRDEAAARNWWVGIKGIGRRSMKINDGHARNQVKKWREKEAQDVGHQGGGGEKTRRRSKRNKKNDHHPYTYTPLSKYIDRLAAVKHRPLLLLLLLLCLGRLFGFRPRPRPRAPASPPRTSS